MYICSCEMYRKYKQCPVEGCKAKPQKRLANHIMRYHKELTPRKRRSLCKKAISVKKTHVEPPKAQRKLLFGSKVKYPTASPGPSTSGTSDPRAIFQKKRIALGSTRDMKFYPLTNPKISDFRKYLESIDGGNRAQNTATLITKDISKYLYFSNDKFVDWGTFVDKNQLLDYFETLKQCVGPEGILTKMERTGDALRYLKIYNQSPEMHAKITTVTEYLARWKYTLRKEKRKLAHERLETLSESKLDISIIKDFIDNTSMWERYDNIIKKSKHQRNITEEESKFCVSVLVVTTLYESWQRPGAVRNCTMAQFKAGVLVDDVFVVCVSDHKTGVGGTAKVIFPTPVKQRVLDYITYIRPNLLTDDNEMEYLFVNTDGGQINKMANFIRYMSKEMSMKLPSATAARKGGATAAAQSCSEEKVRLVTRQLSHDPRVHNKYYAAIRGTKDAAQAHKTMKEVLDTSAESTKTVNHAYIMFNSVI